jgi:glycosyltransferase involved in cell wall biosynthesis
MKIVHLCTQDNGGAGNAAYRLNEGLRRSGIDSTLIVTTKTKADASVKAIPSDYSRKKSLVTNETYVSPEWQNLWYYWTQKIAEYPNRPAGLEIFTFPESTIDLTEIKEIREADIINLHWVSGMLNFDEKTRAFLSGKRLVWTLHDMNPFTGGCHYAGECRKFENSCGACPQLGSENEHDASFVNFTTRKNFYASLNFNIVSPSKWLAKEARKSALFSRYDIRVIPNGFPTDVFQPYPKTIVREKMGLKHDAILIMFGAAYDTERKGFRYLLEALESITSSEKIYLGVFGNLPSVSSENTKFEIINFGSIDDEKTLAIIYSAADVFVIPSIEDNLPNVVPEALLCGTPVVGFSIGGIPDMIVHKKNGYRAEPKNPRDLAKGIVWAIKNRGEDLWSEARKSAEKKFSLETQAKNYTALYEELLYKKRTIVQTDFHVKKSLPEIPKITVVTPSFNHGEFLEQTILSVLDQNYPNLEYIIMDGGSTDNSVEIIKKYEKYLTYWQSKPDGGQYKAITDGFAKGTGEIMTWINSDDMLAPFSFYVASSVFMQHKDIEWITGKSCIYQQEKDNIGIGGAYIWNRKKYLKDTYKFIEQEGTFWRRSLYEKAGGYVNSDYKLASDLELWVRFFRHAKLYTLNMPMGIFRSHGSQKSVDFMDEYLREADEIIMKENKLVEKNGEYLDDSRNFLVIENLDFKQLLDNSDFDEKLNEVVSSFRGNRLEGLAGKVYELIYKKPENKALYQLLVEYYDRMGNSQIQNLVLWWATVVFKDVSFLSELIVSEISFLRIGVAKNLFNELKRISPQHPSVKKLEEFFENV